MNINDMRVVLDELNVPVTYYSINDSIGSNKYIFRQVHNYWECFYIDERGNENEYNRFYDEDIACEFFIEMMKTEMDY